MPHIKNRFFIVGVPRSGTTLVQSILNINKGITCFPESHFYRLLKPAKTYKIFRIRLRKQLHKFTKEINKTHNLKTKCKKSFFADKQNDLFIKFLDKTALQLGTSSWSEKTPSHLHNIEYISNKVKNASFIHVIRNPLSTVSSLYAVSKKYPEIWGRRSIEDCCIRWNNDLEISLRYKNSKNHYFVSYESIIREKSHCVKRIFETIGMPDPNFSIHDIHKKSIDLISSNEYWKENNTQRLDENNNYKKFNLLFNDSQKIKIESIVRDDLYKSLSSNVI